MSFANSYISRFQVLPAQILQASKANVQLRIVIPCFNENEIITTLQSIQNCKLSKSNIEVIIVVNYSESCSNDIKEFNKKIYRNLYNFSSINNSDSITFLPLYAPNLSKKHAGVGFARKIGMDEATQRFNNENNPQGIIICLDADSIVDNTYLVEIENYFTKHPKITAANIHFEHPLEGNLPKNQYLAIAQYELHLRYYVENLKKIRFPYAFHTVGSSCAIRVSAYCRQGGMNKRQAGEDFYFLQKMFQSENFGEITSTRVIPSARVSTRVPFGTGYAMLQLMEKETPTYYTYHPNGFKYLEEFFVKIPELYSNTNITTTYNSLHTSIQDYVKLEVLQDKILEIKNNSTSIDSFTKRFFQWFNGFQVFKFLNFCHQEYEHKIPIEEAVKSISGFRDKTIFEVLLQYREMQKM